MSEDHSLPLTRGTNHGTWTSGLSAVAEAVKRTTVDARDRLVLYDHHLRIFFNLCASIETYLSDSARGMVAARVSSDGTWYKTGAWPK